MVKANHFLSKNCFANVTGAIFSSEYGTVQWDENTNWQGIQGINSTFGVPNKLKQQLDLTD